jgi:adenylate cyclase
MESSRRLVAIMFTDIQGYTALMQQSEDQALTLRTKHRRVFEQATSNHKGEILQYYGDGTLSVFDSAVDAVKCGIDIQRAMLDEPVVPLRIGIHSGDIILTENDIIGDGVNVASRVESLGVPGSILVSDKVYDEIKNSSAIQTKFLKTVRLKNVERPIGIHAITNSRLIVPDVRNVKGKTEDKPGTIKVSKKWLIPTLITIMILALAGFWFGTQWEGTIGALATKKVVVIPFEVAPGFTDEDYAVTGLTDGFIGELSKVDQLKVINQPSTQVVLAGVSSSDVVTNTLRAVDYFVEGEFSRTHNQLVIDVSLKDSLNGTSTWTKHYTRDMSEIRQLWAEAANDLATEMGIEVKAEDAALWTNLRRVNPETYELYLKGIHYMNKSTEADWQRGLVYFQEALDQNPSDPYAYAGLGEAYVRLGHGPAPPPDVFPKALIAAQRAIQLDSNLAEGWAALAHYHTYFGHDWELAEYAFKRANALNPNLAYNHYHRAWYLALFGRMNEAIEEHKRAQELDPFVPLHTAWLGELYRWVGLYDEGLAEAAKAAQMQDDYALSMFIKGSIYFDQGRTEEAIEILRRASEINPGWRYIGYGPACIRAGRIEEGKKVIAELESMPPTPFGALCLGTLYATLGDRDKAIEWLQFKEKHGWYPWIRVMFISDYLKDDPRFLALIREMNLPDLAPLEFDPEVL